MGTVTVVPVTTTVTVTPNGPQPIPVQVVAQNVAVSVLIPEVAAEIARAEAAEAANASAITAETNRATAAEALLAPKASPALTGTPTAPTPSALDNSMKLATTAYADGAVAVEKTRALAAEALLIPTSQKGAANGVATLDVAGQLTLSQWPVGLFEYKGTWNASTNSPALANGTGRQGDVYVVTVAGTTNFGAGGIAFQIGDRVAYDGTAWSRWNAPDGVSSVAGRLGDVTLTHADITDWAALTTASFASFMNLAKTPDAIIAGNITRNAQEVVTSADVVWPDGTTGTFTTDSIGSLNTIDAYHITRVISGVTHTYTQSAITRDSSGAATAVPAMTYS